MSNFVLSIFNNLGYIKIVVIMVAFSPRSCECFFDLFNINDTKVNAKLYFVVFMQFVI